MLKNLILLTTPDMCRHYNPLALDKIDRLRLKQTPQLEQRLDWQSSRFLKQQIPNNQYHTLSLSHKKGHSALFIYHLPQQNIGIDLEYMQDRDYLALSTLFCTPSEQNWLRNQPNRQIAFYQLWGIKEAIIKATHGQLADMQKLQLIDHYQHHTIPSHLLPQPMHIDTCYFQKWIMAITYPVNYTDPSPHLTYAFGQWHTQSFYWQPWIKK